MNRVLQVVALGVRLRQAQAAQLMPGSRSQLSDRRADCPRLLRFSGDHARGGYHRGNQEPGGTGVELAHEEGRDRRNADVASPTAERSTRCVGSGVVFVASQGLIITNNHVIDHADELTVARGDSRKLRAKRVGSDPDTDVAIIKVQLNNLTAVESSMKS